MISQTDDVYLMMTFARRPLFLKVDSTPRRCQSYCTLFPAYAHNS